MSAATAHISPLADRRLVVFALLSVIVHGALLVSWQPSPLEFTPRQGALPVHLVQGEATGKRPTTAEPAPEATPTPQPRRDPQPAEPDPNKAPTPSQAAAEPTTEPSPQTSKPTPAVPQPTSPRPASPASGDSPAKEHSSAPEPSPSQQTQDQGTAAASAASAAEPTTTDKARPGSSTTPSAPAETSSEATPPAPDRAGVMETLRHQLDQHFTYPLLAQRRGWEGKVVLDVHIRAGGQIETIQIAQSSGHGLLDQAARQALSQVETLPEASSLLHGQELRVRLPVIYRLTKG